MQKFLRRLERFSQSLLSPLSYLSAAGLLLVLGALLTSKPLCQALPVLQWAPLQLVGQLLYNGMMVVETACGKQTKAEALGFTEMAIARVCNYV